MSSCILEVKEISKRFGGIQALDNVSINLQAGEVLAIAGENGAGKSTLIKIITGLLTEYEGQIFIGGRKVTLGKPSDALLYGLSYIPQELSLVPNMTVRDNIFLGRELKKGIFIDKKKMGIRSNEALSEIGCMANQNDSVSNLGSGDQQLIEIARALSLNSDILVMDEPTAALTNQEIDTLLSTINELKSRGKSIIFITHKIDEIFRISDRIVVLKNGKLVWARHTKELTKTEVVKAMVGKTLTSEQLLRGIVIDDEKLEPLITVQNLALNKKVRDVTFTVYKNEIFGITGLLGSGRTEILLSLFGVMKPKSGKIVYHNGKSESLDNPVKAVNSGIALLPEDRKTLGLVLDLTVRENITLSSLKRVTEMGIINNKKEINFVERLIKFLTIKAESPNVPVKNLSGGNQQKVVLAKCIASEAKILLLDEATHGVDVGAKEEIFKYIQKLNEEGMTVIMVSSESDELLKICDRILVLKEGRGMDILDRSNMSADRIMTLSAGE